MRSWIGVWFSLLGVLSGCGDAPSTMDAGAGDSSVMLDGGGNDTSMNEDAGCLGADADGDGVPDACDVCALGADQLDADIDGVPDACDQCPGFSDQLDGDSDGVPNSCDVCLTGDDELDGDGDGIPTACDACDSGPNGADADTDGVPDACDVCAASDDALDADADGTPNGCDICGGFDDTVDSDADGVPEGCDVCAGHDDGMDGDTDGTPDGCDCEPTLPEIHPAALETCDGIDNDCTGGADDGLSACPVGCTAGQVDWDLDGASCESAGRVIFVNGAATGNDDGTSWAHAYADLEDAILDAEQAPAGRKQIWIAQGTYSPSREPDDSTDPGERSFVVPAATALLGGFEGSEFAAPQAAPATFVTELARGEDTWIRALDVRSLDVRLDGLSIDVEWGIGLQVEGGEVLASRLIFLGSINIMGPGGAQHVQLVSGTLHMTDSNLAFGLVGVQAFSGSFVCERCAIRHNGIPSPSLPPFGGMIIHDATVTLRNSWVVGNLAYDGSGSDIPAGGITIVHADGRLRAENTTIARNLGSRTMAPAAPNAPAGLDVQLGSAVLVNSIVYDNGGSDVVVATRVSSSVEGDAGACDPLLMDGPEPDYFPVVLGAGSLCIDAGDSTMAAGSVDFGGAPRVQGAAVDLGAFETTP